MSESDFRAQVRGYLDNDVRALFTDDEIDAVAAQFTAGPRRVAQHLTLMAKVTPSGRATVKGDTDG